jgi:hypothetical protein
MVVTAETVFAVDALAVCGKKNPVPSRSIVVTAARIKVSF